MIASWTDSRLSTRNTTAFALKSATCNNHSASERCINGVWNLHQSVAAHSHIPFAYIQQLIGAAAESAIKEADVAQVVADAQRYAARAAEVQIANGRA